MNRRKSDTKEGPPANSPKQRKQQALSWLLHQVMGADGNLKTYGIPHLPELVVMDVNIIRTLLKALEKDLRNHLQHIE